MKVLEQCDSFCVPLKNVCRRVVNYSQCLCQHAAATAAFPFSLSPPPSRLPLSSLLLLVLSSYVTGQLAFRYVARGRRHFTWTLFKVGKLVNFSAALVRPCPPPAGLPTPPSPAAGAWPFRRNLDCFRVSRLRCLMRRRRRPDL